MGVAVPPAAETTGLHPRGTSPGTEGLQSRRYRMKLKVTTVSSDCLIYHTCA